MRKCCKASHFFYLNEEEGREREEKDTKQESSEKRERRD